MKITAVIPTLNPVKEWLQQSLDSLIGFDEIIIGDDYSDKPVLLEDYKFPANIKVAIYRNEKRQGCFKTINNLIKIAQGTWICTHTDDDFFDVRILREILPRLDTTFADVVHFPCLYFGAVSHIYGTNPNPEFESIYIANNIFGGSFFRKEMWEMLEGFQLDVAGDWDFWLRALKSGFKFEYFPKVAAYFRISERSMFEDKLRKYGRGYINRLVHHNVDKWTRILHKPCGNV